MNNVHKLSADSQPVFPCWLWKTKPTLFVGPVWLRHETFPSDIFTTTKDLIEAGSYTHWSPDAPTAPTCVPDEGGEKTLGGDEQMLSETPYPLTPPPASNATAPGAQADCPSEVIRLACDEARKAVGKLPYDSPERRALLERGMQLIYGTTHWREMHAKAVEFMAASAPSHSRRVEALDDARSTVAAIMAHYLGDDKNDGTYTLRLDATKTEALSDDLVKAFLKHFPPQHVGGEELRWNTGTPDVKLGGCETFWCCIEGANGKRVHAYLDYANRHVMPLADHVDEEPDGVEPVPGSDGDYYWTGWHEKSCENCDTQWMFKQLVVAWMRLPKFGVLAAALSQRTSGGSKL